MIMHPLATRYDALLPRIDGFADATIHLIDENADWLPADHPAWKSDDAVNLLEIIEDFERMA